jgi:rhodanese-related sulfurtransferase
MSKPTWRCLMLLSVTCFALITLSTAMAADEDKFPLRKKWPDLTPISTPELAAARAKKEAIVVDVRTSSEYEILHVEGSHHIPHDRIGLKDDSLGGITKSPYKLLVFYCNGTTCTKSYKAAEMAKLMGFEGVRVYDDGIFEWARAYPAESVFFGRKGTKELVEQYVIDEEGFEKGPWNVDTFRFIDLAKSGDYQIVDIREPREKTEYPIILPNLSEATLDQLVKRLEKGDFANARILVLDNVGKQVIWAKYYLDRYGIKEYSFLKGGVRQWRADGLDSKGNKLGKVYGRPAPK